MSARPALDDRGPRRARSRRTASLPSSGGRRPRPLRAHGPALPVRPEGLHLTGFGSGCEPGSKRSVPSGDGGGPKRTPTVTAATATGSMTPRRRVDLGELLGLPMRTRVVRCPLHDDRHASLSLDADRGLWWCFVCQVGGDVLSWFALVEGLDWADALERLEQMSGLPRPRKDPREIRGVTVARIVSPPRE